MESSTMIAIGIILLLAIVVGVFVASSRRAAAKKKQQLMSNLQQLAHRYGTSVGLSDVLGAKVIALDKTKGRIFYVNGFGDTTLTEAFDIEDVSQCSVLCLGQRTVLTSGKGKTKTEVHVDKVVVEVNTRTGGKINLLFYDEAMDGVLEMLPLKEKAEKWKNLIKN